MFGNTNPKDEKSLMLSPKGMLFGNALGEINEFLSDATTSLVNATTNTISSALTGEQKTFSPNGKGYSYVKNGWTYISIYGGARERGVAYGYLSAKGFAKIQKMLVFLSMEEYGMEWKYFLNGVESDFIDKIKVKYPELYEECEGIADGCVEGGTQTTVTEVIAYNLLTTLLDSWYSSSNGNVGMKEGGASDKCSSFIATGSYTQDGNIVIAHNTFDNFITGQHFNVILQVKPDRGNSMLFQTSPCMIWSGTDFFVTSAGIVGSETTIGGFTSYDNGEDRYPIGFRIRDAMQNGNNLSDYERILIEGNSGDYACSWLFGDVNANEIMRIELGLKFQNVERSKDGYFVGFNSVYDPRIRNFECVNSGFYDVRRHQGARRVRLPQLMEDNKGKINADVAKTIIADHYDIYLEKENPCSRTVCSHYELDAREYMSESSRPLPFQPRGAVDGKIATADMIRGMKFEAKYGSSCKGLPFIVADFCKKHAQWANFGEYLFDRTENPWTIFTAEPQINTGNSQSRESSKQQSVKHDDTDEEYDTDENEDDNDEDEVEEDDVGDVEDDDVEDDEDKEEVKPSISNNSVVKAESFSHNDEEVLSSPNSLVKEESNVADMLDNANLSESDDEEHKDSSSSDSDTSDSDEENICLLYTSPSPRDRTRSRMPSSA